MSDDHETEEAGKIPTNLRLLVILEEVARAGVPVAPSTLCELVGLPKPTVHRLLHTDLFFVLILFENNFV